MAHGEAPETRYNAKRIEFSETGTTAVPDITLSGGLFLSGGALTYMGSTGKCTLVAAA